MIIELLSALLQRDISSALFHQLLNLPDDIMGAVFSKFSDVQRNRFNYRTPQPSLKLTAVIDMTQLAEDLTLLLIPPQLIDRDSCIIRHAQNRYYQAFYIELILFPACPNLRKSIDKLLGERTRTL